MAQPKPDEYMRIREREALQRLTERLRAQFPELPASDVDAAIHGRYQEYDASPIRDFVAVLVERAAVADLRAARAGSSHA